MPERRSLLEGMFALGLAAAMPLPSFAQAAAFDLAALTGLLSQVKSGEATFTEKRTVAMLDRTLESSGRLSFAAPDTFVRETLKPRRDKVAVVGNQVTLNVAGRTRTVALDSVPEAAVIMEGIRGTLTGNRELLERHFTTAVAGNAQRWTLELVPLEPRLQELVASIRVVGQQSHAREVTVTMADGDKSVMSIEQIPAAARPASAAS
jgi:outer membrane lipoprotein-sorting protein